MRKIILLSFCLTFFLGIQSKAQVYIQGDITAVAMINGTHDSTQCASFATEMYSFTINNSFLGDSIIIKDQSSGFMMAFDVNATGANPWITTIMTFSMPPVVPDYMVSGGFAMFGGAPIKFINGSDTIQNVFSFLQLPVPNPCSYGNVSGKVYIDNNNDCVFNAGDDPLQSLSVNAAVTLSAGSYSQNGFTASNGDYSIQVQESWLTNYVVSLPPNYQFIFPSVACSPASYTYTTLPQTSANFALQCTSQIDVQSAASGPAAVRPLIPFMLNPYVSNTGCDLASGTLTLIKDPNAIYTASLSTNPATYVNGDTLRWNFVNLSNLSNGAYWNSFVAGVHLTPNGSVNIGDTLCFSVSSTILTGDLNPLNNQYYFCLPVVNSYDPNAKEVSPKGFGVNGQIPASTNHLDYTIHFQNTGTAVAYNVSVTDTLDTDVDPASLRILGNSHTMTPEWLASNVVRFNFYGIMLADSNSNELMSHGQVRFSVKLKSGLALGTQIKNKAEIYFDSNPAIVTNTTLNTLATPNGINVIQDNQFIQMYPNPAESELTISLSELNIAERTTVSILTINNQLIKEVTLSQLKTRLDISGLSAGLYFVRINTGDHSDVRKFIKQ